MNLGLFKLTRCPCCGKWGVVRIQPLVKLRETEQAELERGRAEVRKEAEEKKLRLSGSQKQSLASIDANTINIGLI